MCLLIVTQGVALGYYISRRWREDNFIRMKRQTLQEWAGASRIFALVFTDIVDSTALANELGDEKWIELLMKHFAEARHLMAVYDHHEIKIIGDSFMVIFRTVLDALDFARALYANTGDTRIKIRVGIHVGSARIIEDDIYGNMVNYTKRVESTDNPGGIGSIRLSDVAKSQVSDEKAQRHAWLQFQPLTVTFKGFPQPQTVWLVLTLPDMGSIAGDVAGQWLAKKLGKK